MSGGGRYKDGCRGLKLELELDRKHRKNASVTFSDFGEEDDFLWLSSDCKSPSMLSFFDDDDDDSQDPLWILGAPLVNLDQPSKGGATDGYSEEEEVVIWSTDCSSGVCSESGDSCFTPSLCESSCTTLSMQEEEEDAAAVVAAATTTRSAGECREQGFTPDCDSSEPIFWPFDHKLYVLRDFEKNFLCVSPRKDARNVGAAGGLESSKSISPLPERSTRNVQARRNYDREERTRKITISPPPRRCNEKSNRNARPTAAPTRPSRLYQASSGNHDCAIARKEKLLQLGAKTTVPDLEMDTFQSLVAQGAAVETLVGLNEFDGHEGIDVGGCDDGDELVLD